MTPKTLTSKIESCTLQLHAWKPFDPPFNSKKPCRSDRSTAPNPNPNHNPNNLDLSKLSLIDDPNPTQKDTHAHTRQWFHRKRRRRGSRSVSGRSSDRSGTHRRLSAAYATCSDIPLVAAGGTDSSGELFVNGEGSWGSDASESRILMEKEKEIGGGGFCYGYFGGVGGGSGGANEGNESGYGSEPGYRGDGELGEEDGEFDEEEEDDGKFMFWRDRFGRDRMEVVGENEFSEQKSHHRCRRKKHDWRLIAPLR